MGISKTFLFWETFFLIMIVGMLDWLANFYHLYWVAGEFDSLVHFFGGAFLASFFLWLYFFSGFFVPTKRKLSDFLWVAILGSLFVAVVWEIYELIMGEAIFNESKYPYDTTVDFIMDFLGILAVTFYAYIRELEKREAKNEIS